MTVSGTALYMAPEQAMGDRALDARADIYALGAMMYFALTGRPPFTGDRPFVVMMAHARDPVTPPREVRPDVPADLERVVLRCLAKKPERPLPELQGSGRGPRRLRQRRRMGAAPCRGVVGSPPRPRNVLPRRRRLSSLAAPERSSRSGACRSSRSMPSLRWMNHTPGQTGYASGDWGSMSSNEVLATRR